MWCKMSVFDVATRIPLLISAPWLPSTHGTTAHGFAEAVDIFQTLAELAGIPVPPSEHAQGKSLVPLIKDPAHGRVHTAALSQFPRCWQNASGPVQRVGDENNNTNSAENMADCHWASHAEIAFMGYSMRTDKPFPLRYTEWVRWNGTRPIWDDVYAVELYNHSGDTGAAFKTDAYENVNIAPHQPAVLLAKLAAELRREFQQYLLDEPR